MRIHDTPDRERLYKNVLEASNQNTKSKALDDAARYYCRMRGNVAGYGNGNVHELLAKAEREGSVTPHEIAEILDERELPVEYRTDIDVGES